MKSYGVIIQMKATEQYFPVVLFIMLYKVVWTFESEDFILWSALLKESFWQFLHFNVTTCFSLFSENEISKIVLNFDFSRFWKKGWDFFIREMWLLSKMVYFSFLVLAGRVYGNWSQGSNFTKTRVHCWVLFCGAHSEHCSSVSGIHGRGKKNLSQSK